jgi:hypothetical protein
VAVGSTGNNIRQKENEGGKEMKDHDSFGLDNLLEGVPVKIMDRKRIVIVTPNMTAKQYAAIHLKVPRSGDPDIDAMIRESRRAEFMKAVLSGPGIEGTKAPCNIALQARVIAEAALAEWEKEAGK